MALSNLHILVVEDDSVFRQLITSFLCSLGATVEDAEDGQQGLVLFLEKDFDIVIADLSMPHLNGLTMLKQMNNLKPELISVVISANYVMTDVVEALRIGASDYLIKPLSNLHMISDAILAALDPTTSRKYQANNYYHELNLNLDKLRYDESAAAELQGGLFPSNNRSKGSAYINYTIFKQQDLSRYFVDFAMVDKKHVICYMADLGEQTYQYAYLSALLKSTIDQQLKSARQHKSQSIIDPYAMLSIVNERLVDSGEECQVGLVYMVVELTQLRACIAQAGRGLRCYLRNSQGLLPLFVGQSEYLGHKQWQFGTRQFRDMLPLESLCISTLAAEHKTLLLDSHFKGVMRTVALPDGGYLQLSLNS